MQVNRYLDQARRMLRGAGSFLMAGALVAALALGGCSPAEAATETTAQGAAASSAQSSQDTSSPDWYDPTATSIDISGMDFEYGNRESLGEWDADGATTITLGDSIAIEGDGASVAGSTVTIDAAGTYVISGTSSNAQLVVNAADEDKVQIVLNGASITCENGPALLVQNADKVFVTLAEGTENALADTAGNTATLGEGDEAESLNAAVYAKDDICFNGSGALTVTGASAHAIKGKDDVVITGGTYHITAAQDGIRGKESVKITGAEIDITAGSDGIQTSETDSDDKGFISIDGGTLTITATDDGIQASRYLRITGGTVNVVAGDDALHSDIDGLIAGGDITLQAGDDAFHTEFNLGISGGTVDVQRSYEGLEGQLVVVADGTLNIVSNDDALNASQGSEEQDTGDDSDTASNSAEPAAAGGSGNVAASDAQAQPEGARQTQAISQGDEAPDPSAGDLTGAPEQDAQQGNAQPGGDMRGPRGGGRMPSGQAPQGDMGQASGEQAQGQGLQNAGGPGAMGGGMMDDDGVSMLVIEGGTIDISTGGDGLDSNGDIVMTGGTVYVSGPENDGNGSLDYGGNAIITGGTIIAAGSSGMAETFGGDSTQASILAQASGQAGDTVSIVDGSGKEVASYQVTKRFACVIASVPGMEEGASYTVLVNGSEAASVEATTQQSATGFGGGMPGMGDRGDAMGGMRGQDGMGPGMRGQALADAAQGA